MTRPPLSYQVMVAQVLGLVRKNSLQADLIIWMLIETCLRVIEALPMHRAGYFRDSHGVFVSAKTSEHERSSSTRNTRHGDQRLKLTVTVLENVSLTDKVLPDQLRHALRIVLRKTKGQY